MTSAATPGVDRSGDRNGTARNPDDDRRRGRTWDPRFGLARALRVAVVLVPLLVALLATWLLRPHLPDPRGLLEATLFVAALMLTAFTVAAATSRMTRRLLPLASLFELSLVFPDRAPSRYSAALRAGSPRRLRRQVDEIRTNRFSRDGAEAAEQILDLLEALRRHEPGTRGHSERVRAYSEMIARELGMGDDERARLQWGVLLHDIGKLEVPASLLDKNGAPTAEEWAVIRRHPEVGATMVAPLESWLGPMVHAAGQHHERWDGSGYPLGLAGERISLVGRIVAVADAYDVITSARAYKQPLDPVTARRELMAGSGSQFDPDVVKAMLRVSVGDPGAKAGRLAWLAHVPSLFQPGAVGGGVGGTVVGGAGAGLGGAIGSGVAGAAIALAATATGVVPVQSSPVPTDLAFVAAEAAPGIAGRVPSAGEASEGGDVAPTTLPAVTAPSAGDAAAPDADPEPGSERGSESAIPTSTAPVTVGAASGDPGERTDQPNSSTTRSPSSTAAPIPAPTLTPGPTSTSTPTSTPIGGGGGSSSTTVDDAGTTTTVATTAECASARAGATALSGADLRDCDLSGVDLVGVDLSDADLRGADLTGASIAGFNLSGADLAEAVLVGVVLTDGNMTEVDLADVDASGARIERVDLARTALGDASFVDAVLVDVSFGFAVGAADFSRAALSGVNFNDARIGGSRFDAADASGVEWWRTDATGVSLAGTDVDGAVFGDTDLTGATGTPVGAGGATYLSAVCPDGAVRSSPCW